MVADMASEGCATRSSLHVWLPGTTWVAPFSTSRGAVPNYVNAFAVQSRAYTTTFDSLNAAALITVPTLIVHSERALAPGLARRFVGGLGGSHDELWLRSAGQIDFYDQPALIDAAADAIVTFFRQRLWPQREPKETIR